MGLEDHGDVIATVADAEGDRVFVIVFDKAHHIRFLPRRHTAADHCLAGFGDFEESRLVGFALHYDSQSVSSHEHASLLICFLKGFVALDVFCCGKFSDALFIFQPINSLKILCDQTAGVGDVFGCLQFVSREHPDLDVGLLQVRYGLGHVVLKSVLHSCGANQHEISLKVVEDFLEPLISLCHVVVRLSLLL